MFAYHDPLPANSTHMSPFRQFCTVINRFLRLVYLLYFHHALELLALGRQNLDLPEDKMA